MLTAAAAALIVAQASPSPVARPAADVSQSAAVAAPASQPHPSTRLASDAYPRSYVVANGDTLSSIAASQYGSAADWPAIYDANHPPIRWADIVPAGMSLTIPAPPATVPDPPAELAPPPPPPPPAPVVQRETPAAAPAAQPAAPVQETATGSVTAGSGYEACVIRAESGGNAGAVNASSGAGGLYQFLPSTWASLGYSGLPEDAPVAEQQAAFQRLYAESGSSPWSSDGCG